jgi:hypothetical protein
MSLGLIVASPAAHADPLVHALRADFTFTFHGREVTCTVVGRSTYEYFPENDPLDRSVFTARTRLVDTDPECSEALIRVEAYVVGYRRGGDVIAYAEATSPGPRVDVLTYASEPAVEVEALHRVWFVVDDFPDGQPFSFFTSPK